LRLPGPEFDYPWWGTGIQLVQMTGWQLAGWKPVPSKKKPVPHKKNPVPQNWPSRESSLDTREWRILLPVGVPRCLIVLILRRTAFLWSATKEEPYGTTCAKIAQNLDRKILSRGSERIPVSAQLRRCINSEYTPVAWPGGVMLRIPFRKSIGHDESDSN
jgi:hypothetical protein